MIFLFERDLSEDLWKWRGIDCNLLKYPYTSHTSCPGVSVPLFTLSIIFGVVFTANDIYTDFIQPWNGFNFFPRTNSSVFDTETHSSRCTSCFYSFKYAFSFKGYYGRTVFLQRTRYNVKLLSSACLVLTVN